MHEGLTFALIAIAGFVSFLMFAAHEFTILKHFQKAEEQRAKSPSIDPPVPDS